jgi:hypothetical protein
MADAQTTNTIVPGQYYQVTVTGMFNHAGEHYEPGTTYYVPDAIYNGMLDDGTTNFKNMCVTAQAMASY